MRSTTNFAKNLAYIQVTLDGSKYIRSNFLMARSESLVPIFFPYITKQLVIDVQFFDISLKISFMYDG